MTESITSNIIAWLPVLILIAAVFALAWANLRNERKPKIGNHYADLQKRALRNAKGKRL